MPELEIHYFPFKGRGEGARLVLHIGGVKFKDVRINMKEYRELKASGAYRYARVPVMYVDGVQYAESTAIMRYAAEVAGLLPKEPTEALAAEEYVCAINEMIDCLFKAAVKGADALRESREEFVKTDAPRLLGGIVKGVTERGAKGPWLVGTDISYADVQLYWALGRVKHGQFDHVPKDLLETYYPVLAKAWDAVHNHPKVVEWNKVHPW